MKKNIINKIVTVAATLTLTLSFAACGKEAEPALEKGEENVQELSERSAANDTATTDTKEVVSLKVGANITPHAEILEQAKPLLAEKGINLEIVRLEDSITPNTGVIEGSLDANYFQHVPYLDQFNAENGSDLVSVGAIHYEPF